MHTFLVPFPALQEDTMDLTAFAKEILNDNGPNAAEIALAALQGDKDAVIRLLAARTVPLHKPVQLLMPGADAELEAAHRARAAAEDRVTELKIENRALRATIEKEQARILELNGLVFDAKADYEQMRDDFCNTDHGWDSLGSGLAKLLGVEWDCDNEKLLQLVNTLGTSYESEHRLAEKLTREKAALEDHIIRLERGENTAALKSKISDLEAIVFAQNAREAFRR